MGTKLTPERRKTILECVQAGMSNKDAGQVSGISESTLYAWIERGRKAKSGPFLEFLESYNASQSNFEHANFELIHEEPHRRLLTC